MRGGLVEASKPQLRVSLDFGRCRRPRYHSALALALHDRSRLAIGLAGGGRFNCEDIRTGCPGMVSSDGRPGDYSYIDIVTTPDGR
jgi:hypothetical protein